MFRLFSSVLGLGLVFGSLQVSAGGLVGGLAKPDLVSCQGNGVELVFSLPKGTYRQGDIVQLNQQKNAVLRMERNAFLDAALQENFLEITKWDKTAYLADLGVDIDSVSDHLVLNIANSKVDHVAGGKLDYKTPDPLASEELSKFPKAFSPKKFTNIKVDQSTSTDYFITMEKIEAEVLECLRTELQPNPWLGETEETATLEVCVESKTVKPARIAASVFSFIRIESCQLN